MSRLLIYEPGTFLGVKRGRFVIKKENHKIDIPPTKIKQILILTRGANLSTAALGLASFHKIPIFLHSRDGTFLSYFHPLISSNIILRKKQYEAFHDKKGIELAKKFAIAKLYNQKTILYQYSRIKRYSTDIKNFLIEKCEKIKEYLDEIREIQILNYDKLRKKIIKLEAEGSKYYWEGFKILLKKEAKFDKRKKKFDKPNDPVNICLNYGYSILGSQVLNSIIQSGLDPYFGFLHVISTRRASLVMDLMEEFRQVVIDRVVLKYINSLEKPNEIVEKGEMDKYYLKREKRYEFVKRIFERFEEKVTYEERKLSILDHVLRQARKICDFLLDREKNYIPFLER